MKRRSRLSKLPRANQANHGNSVPCEIQPGMPRYKCTSIFKELHGQAIYGVSMNNICRSSDEDPLLLASVGHNRVSIYECVRLPPISTLARLPLASPLKAPESALNPSLHTQPPLITVTADKTQLTVDLESQSSTATPPLSTLSSISSAPDALSTGPGFSSTRVPDVPIAFGRPTHYRTRSFNSSSNIRFLRALSDPDPSENLWSVCWSYASPEQLERENDSDDSELISISSSDSTDTDIRQALTSPSPQQQMPTQGLPPDQWSGHAKQLLITAGFRGVIRVISVLEMRCIRTLMGHSGPINNLKVHACHPFLVFSASKDFTVRLWNIVSACCVAVFGGLDGHRLEVVSLDLSEDFGRLATCSQDHSVRIWLLNKPSILNAIDKSNDYSVTKKRKSFEPVSVQFPDFCTRNIHSSYVDSIHWFGDFVLSKV